MTEAEDSVKRQIQRTLTDVLLTDSHLAFTLLRTAAIESDIDPRQCEIALERARVALNSIRRFLVQVEDPAVRGRFAPAQINWRPSTAAA
jgi:hypothetical protein